MNQEKVMMITGATKGLGRALAFHFARKGWKLAICARNGELLKETEAALKGLGTEVIAISADVSKQEDIERFVSITESEFEKVDVLVNNASIFGPGPKLLVDYEEKNFLDVITVNVMNPFLVTKRVLPGMLSRNSGSIINITSEAGKTGFGEWGAYGISKFAVEGMTQTWADELEETGVRINMVDPGEMDTEMHNIAVPDYDYLLTKPEEVTDVFDYLALDASINVNGQRFQAQEFTYPGGREHE